MKIILILLTLTSSPASFAGELSCFLNSYYSQVQVQWTEESLRVKVNTPRGYEAMPQFEAPMPPEMLKFMEHQASELSGLGSSFTYQWQRSQCEISGDNPALFSCHGPVAAEESGNPVKAALVTSAQIEEKSLSGTNRVLRVRFIFNAGKGLYFVAIPFPEHACRLTEGKPSAKARSGENSGSS
jgi:hypothetical protein